MSTKTLNKALPFLSLALLLAILSPSPAFSQGRNVEVYDPADERRSTYVPEGGVMDGIRTGLNIDSGTPGAEGEAPRLFWVRRGQRIYCNHCGLLIDDTVQTQQVSEAQTRFCFDDGSHGDDIANDGVPTNVEEIRGLHLCPYCWKNKTLYEEYVKKCEEWGARKVYDIYAGTYNEKKERRYVIPIPGVTPTPPPDAFVPEKPPEVTSILEMDRILEAKLEEFEATVLVQYENLAYHPDNIRFPQNVFGQNQGVPNFGYPYPGGYPPAGYPAPGGSAYPVLDRARSAAATSSTTACPNGGTHTPGTTDANGKLHCAKCGQFM